MILSPVARQHRPCTPPGKACILAPTPCTAALSTDNPARWIMQTKEHAMPSPEHLALQMGLDIPDFDRTG